MRTGKDLQVQNMFRELFEAAPDPTVIIHEAGGIQMCNHQASLLFGYSNDELEGKPAAMIIPGYNKNNLRGFSGELNNPSNIQTELRGLRKDGTVFPAEVRFSSLLTEKGTLILARIIDISSRKKQSDKLIKVEKNFELLVKSVSDYAIFLIDTKGRVASWNSGAEKIKGYKAGEIIGSSIEVFYSEEDINAGIPKKNLAKALELGHFETEGWRLRKDGSAFFADVVFTALYDEGGKHYGYAKVTRDITEKRKNAQRTGYLATIAANIQDLVIATDNDFRITSWNQSAEKLLGWEAEEAIGKTTTEVLKIIYPDVTREEILDDFKIRGFWQGEVIYHTRSGTPVHIHATVSYLKDREGNITGTLAIARDISKIKESQNRLVYLAKIVEETTESIFSIGEGELISTWNKGAEKNFGYTKEEAIGKSARDLGIIRLTENELKVVHQQLEEEGSISGEVTYYRKDGSTFLGSVTGNLIKDSRGRISSFYFIVKDISQRKQLEDALKKTNEVLEQRVEERTRELGASEKRFRALIENTNDIIILMDAGFNVIYRSPSAQRITGRNNAELLGQLITTHIHPDDLEYARNGMKELISNPGKTLDIFFRNKHKHGHYMWLEGTVVNLLHVKEVNAIVLNCRDVTDRNEALDKLKASEIRFRSLIENSAEGIALTDEFSNIIYRSPASEKITGIIATENSVNRTHPDDLEMIKEKLVETKNNPGIPIPFQGRFLHAKGHYFWLEGTLTNLFHVKGVEAIVANYRDITERKEAEKNLILSEKRFRALTENISDAIVMNDAESKIIYQSPSVEKILGYSIEERAGKKVLEYIHPDDRNEFLKLYENLKERPNSPLPFEYRFLHKSGSYIWLEGVVTNLLDEPAVNAYVANYRDITERKEAEASLKKSERIYRTIASSIPGSVITLLDPDFRYLLIEGDMLEKLGYKKEALLGNLAKDVLDPDIYNGVADEFRRVLQGEMIIRENNRNGYDTISRLIPLKDDHNRVYMIMTVTLDVSEIKKAQRELNELNHLLEEKIALRTEQLKKSNEELEAFSYSVSHDLRAPLRGIIGFATILEEDYADMMDEDAKRITGIIKANTQKMGALIDDLLTFSRMGRHELQKMTIDSNEIVNEIIAANSHRENIEWVVAELPKVEADINTIRQVWINLISNAVKYSSKNEHPRIEIGSQLEGSEIRFYVKDNGVGFDEKYKAKLFGVFQRLHSTGEFEGTGIGLAIVEKIVSKHGGTVRAEGRVNEGACFCFSLPANWKN